MKALALFSGGLDSILAVKLIKEQGIEVVGVTFVSPFFDASRAQEMSSLLGLPLIIQDITEDLLPLVISPRYGYGQQMNPCLDCRILMFTRAKEIMEREGAQFLIAGEVLGERPLTQNRQALLLTARRAGLEGYVLRPLSALLLPPTVPEEEGWVDRSKLLGIKGRSRKPQMELAKRLGIERYPSPGGGCLLTDPGYAQRLKRLLIHRPQPSRRELELLKYGRHFFLSGCLVVVSRREEENPKILELKREEDLLLSLKNLPGPRTLVIGDPSWEELLRAAALTVRYSKARERKRTWVLAVREKPSAEEEILVTRQEVEGVCKIQPEGGASSWKYN